MPFSMEGSVTLRDDRGKGRAFVIAFETGSYQTMAEYLFSELSRDVRVLLISVDPIGDDSWRSQTTSLVDAVKNAGVRQASFVGFGAACSLVQNVCLREPKLVRTAAFIDGSSRPHPSRIIRIIDWIERVLPLGLPLRSSSRAFDGRAFLQRIRCPSLVISSSLATPFLRSEADELVSGMPTSWWIELPREGEIDELGRLIQEFHDVPAKCPQKNVRERREASGG